MRVFVSRFSPGLQPGQGNLIDWEIGERTFVLSGQDEGRIFIVMSRGMIHNDAPIGTYVREGYFEDDPDTRCAKSEGVLWFISVPFSKAELRP